MAPEVTDILIRHVAVVTADADRRALEDAAIGLTGERITITGPDCGLAGRGLARSLGTGDVDRWFDACENKYTTGSTVDFWRADARLAPLERSRLKNLTDEPRSLWSANRRVVAE